MAIVIVTNPILWSWGSRSAARTRQRGVPQPEISICSSDPLHNCFGGAQNLIATSQHTVFFKCVYPSCSNLIGSWSLCVWVRCV